MSKDYLLYLVHILEEIALIEEFTKGGKKKFLHDTKTYYAVLRGLQTLAESTQKLPTSLKARHPHMGWREISGFRNILVHAYLEGYDKESIWDAVTEDLPRLKAALEQEYPDWKARKKKGK